eukprot:TRINITY_DN7638_c0_g2_i4.p1 TRINITY_DN7638_c0_g2~~TRINITY_DN7638_c0_g2_i4.p1  ORF type:complete len:535 (+),score=20.82 TRINITY_DN7638_c0_g2_i4:755-2359(+)
MSIWNLPNLFLVEMSNNFFSGDAGELISPVSSSSFANYNYRYLFLDNNFLTGKLYWRFFSYMFSVTELSLRFNMMTGFEELTRKLTWKRLDLTGNPILGHIPDSYVNFNRMDYIGLRQTRLSHQNNSLLPTFSTKAAPYNLKDRYLLYVCPTIRRLSSPYHSEIDIDPSYYENKLCQCLPNYFGSAGRCLQCPSGCDCSDGVILRRCHPSPDVMNVSYIIQCPQPSACIFRSPTDEIEWRDQITLLKGCQKGYQNRACSQCEIGYGRQGLSCSKCEESMQLTSLILGLVCMIGLIVYLYRWSNNTSAKFRITIFHIQTLSILSVIVKNSKSVNQLLDWTSSTSSLQIPNTACLLGSTNLKSSVMLGFIRVPILIVLSFTLFLIKSRKRDQVIYVAINLLLFFFYDVSNDVFRVFGCTIYDEGEDKWFLNAAPWIECGPPGKEMKELLSMAIPMFLIYVIGFPTMLLVTMKSACNSSAESSRVSFLIQPYSQEYWYWELLVIARRLLFSIVIGVVPYTKPGILFFSLMVLIQVTN